MSLLHTKAWDMRRNEIAGQSRTILSVIHGESRVPLERTYMFQYPIHNKDARRERDKRLYNITLLQYIIEAGRRNPILLYFLAVVLLFVASIALILFPPEPIAKSSFYRRVALVPGRISGLPELAAREAQLQYRIPEKVWISAYVSATGVARIYRATWSPNVNTVAWRAPMAREIQELEETYARSSPSGPSLRPSEGLAMVVRGDVRFGSGQAVKARDAILLDREITTGPFSFLQIWLQDGSTLSVGPDSTLKLEPASADEPALVELTSGSVRAMVRKSTAIDEASQERDKLYVRTRGAVLDVRGSDSLIAVSAATGGTTVLTFDGRVTFGKRAAADEPSSRTLAAKDVRQVMTGGYSETRPDMSAPTVPTQLPPAQLERLKLSSDIIGPQEVAQQQQNLRYAEDLEKSGLLRYRENTSLLRYESFTDEQLSELAAHVARRSREAPKPEDYDRVEAPPSDLAVDWREFPDAAAAASPDK